MGFAIVKGQEPCFKYGTGSVQLFSYPRPSAFLQVNLGLQLGSSRISRITSVTSQGKDENETGGTAQLVKPVERLTEFT